MDDISCDWESDRGLKYELQIPILGNDLNKMRDEGGKDL